MPASHTTAVELASIPERIRGYDHVKERYLAKAKRAEAALLARFRDNAVGAVAVATE